MIHIFLSEDIEIFFIKDKLKNNQTLLYAPLYCYIDSVSKSFADNIKSPDALIEIKQRLKNYKKIEIDELLKKPGYLNSISINLTDQCNLRCRYCYLDSEEEMEYRKPMSKEQYESLIHFLIEQKIESKTSPIFTISFYGGGEPTYDDEFFRYCVEYARDYAFEKGIIIRFLMTTNGYYRELSDFIIENIEVVTFSLDGPEHIHNYQRPGIGGKESFSIVFENAKRLFNSKIKLGFRITITDYSLIRWKEIMDFFIEHFPGCNLMVGAMVSIGRGKHSVIKSPNRVDYEACIYEAYQYTKNKLNMVTPDSNAIDKPKCYFCGGASGSSFIISSDGSLVGCANSGADERFDHGSFDFENRVLKKKEENIKKSSQLNVLNYEECRNCFCKYICAGDCPDSRYTNAGIKSCSLTRKIVEDKLNDKIYADNFEKCL